MRKTKAKRTIYTATGATNSPKVDADASAHMDAYFESKRDEFSSWLKREADVRFIGPLAGGTRK